jgi:lycopene cyclase domain-containing protein
MFNYLAFIFIVSFPVITYSTIHRKMLKNRLSYRLFPVYLMILAIGFFVFEIVAISNNWWNFNESNILGIKLFGVPIEELLFFILIPQICLFLWSLIRVDNALQNFRDMSMHHIRNFKDD